MFKSPLVQDGRAPPKFALSLDAIESPSLIVGAGIAGTACALALSDLNVKCMLIDERSPEQLLEGAGINLQAKAIEVLNELGITTRSLIDCGTVIKSQSYYCPDGRHVCTLDKGGKKEGTPGQIAIHRGKLVQLLLDAVKSKEGIRTIFNYRVTDVCEPSSPTEPITLRAQRMSASSKPLLLNGSNVIACDGIHSNIRSKMFTFEGKNGSQDPHHYHGVTHYRGVVEDFPFLLDGTSMIVVGGLNTKIVVYPIAPPYQRGTQTLQSLNWVVAVREEEPNSSPSTHHDHILQILCSEGFKLDFLDLPSLIGQTSSISAWPMVDLDPLETWTKNRTALVGDAAHAMLPVGSGGAMAALLDALALRDAFKKSGPVPIQDVLRLYQTFRYKQVSQHQKKCRLQPAEHIVQEVMDHVPRLTEVPLDYTERLCAAMNLLHRPPSSNNKRDDENIRKRVLIVGAGASGLSACKEFAENGFSATIFESGESFGGVFRDAYQNLELTSSDVFTAFSDYPPSKGDMPTMWSAKEYLTYLHRYAVDNNIFKSIQFNSTVVGIRRIGRSENEKREDENFMWEVEVYNSSTKMTDIIQGGTLVLAVGSNASPSIPTFPGQEIFDGKIIHSSEIDGFESFRGKRVLCLGIGESGSDLPYWIAKEPGTSVTIAARGLGWCAPRRRPLKSGSPSDLNTNRLLWGLPRIYNRLLSFILAYLDSRVDSDPVIKRIGLLNLRHPAGVMKTYGTKSVNFLHAIEYLGAKLVSCSIHSMGPHNRVHFVDGSSGEFDIVVLNTGYNRSSFEGFCFPTSTQKHDGVLHQVLSEASYVRNLYKRVVHPAMKSLYFIGFARPGFASIPAIAETQSRWAASLTSKQCVPLPSEAAMIRSIAEDKLREENQFDSNAARVTTLVDYLPYVNDIASHLGASPPFLKILVSDPYLFLKMFFGPATVAQFRFRGPGAKPDIAYSTIKGYPRVPNRRLTYIALAFYATSLVFLLLSFGIPLPFETRKRLQPVGFAPLRSRPVLLARYSFFLVHLGFLGLFYKRMFDMPIIGAIVVITICLIESRTMLQKTQNEEILREALTTSAEVCGIRNSLNCEEDLLSRYKSWSRVGTTVYVMCLPICMAFFAVFVSLLMKL